MIPLFISLISIGLTIYVLAGENETQRFLGITVAWCGALPLASISIGLLP